MQDVAPSPVEQVCEVQARAADMAVSRLMLQQMASAAAVVGRDIQRLVDDGATRPGTKMELEANLEQLRKSERASRGTAVYSDLCNWANDTRELAAAWKLPRLGLSLQLVEVLRRGSELALDVGRECSLGFVARMLLVISTKATAEEARRKAACSFAGNGASSAADESLMRGAQALWPSSGGSSGGSSSGALSALQQRVQTGPSAAEISVSAASIRRKVCGSLFLSFRISEWHAHPTTQRLV